MREVEDLKVGDTVQLDPKAPLKFEREEAKLKTNYVVKSLHVLGGMAYVQLEGIHSYYWNKWLVKVGSR